jgi:diguanylate cyclase (GGDEF)-like protein
METIKRWHEKRLYSTLIDHYRFFQTYDLRQLHFHLKDNESFLRFHRPGKYGDNLTGIRSTVEWVNENHSALSGFEEGRIYNGFRYVFPLETHSHSYQEHLGSVETSFSAHAIAREFARSHNAKTGFFIHREVVDEKVFKSEHANYIESPMASFYYEKAIKKQLEYEFKHINIDKLDTQSLQLANQKIFEGKLFTLASSDEKMFFTFLPLHNPVTNKIVAALILQVENDRLSRFKYNYIIMLTIGWVLILLTTIFVYREYLTKVLFQNLLRRTQRILDTQKSIIVITNGESIFDVNQTFLDFFGYETLSDFKKRYRCICDRFIQHENYFHLGKVSANRSWVEELHHIPDKDKVVLVQDKEGIEYSMALSFNYYKDEHFVVTFNDISGTIQEQIMLQKKVLIDSLTGAYNREFFASNIDSIIDDTSKRGRAVGILFFDIDHFKNINDTYGHDIGDKVLKELVARVSDSIRESDYLIRWGGEEFIVLIAIRSLKGATRVAEHLRSMIENHSFEEVKSITCSFGVTVLHHDHENIEEAIKRADQALYRSKESGRNRITMDRV